MANLQQLYDKGYRFVCMGCNGVYEDDPGESCKRCGHSPIRHLEEDERGVYIKEFREAMLEGAPTEEDLIILKNAT